MAVCEAVRGISTQELADEMGGGVNSQHVRRELDRMERDGVRVPRFRGFRVIPAPLVEVVARRVRERYGFTDSAG
jgi:hypothetical protein